MGAVPTDSGNFLNSVILGIAHELNNPNTFIRVNATTLKKMLLMARPLLIEAETANPNLKIGPYKASDAIIKMVQLSESILDASVRLISIADKLKQCTTTLTQEKTKISLVTVIQQMLQQHQFLIQRIKGVEQKFDSEGNFTIKAHNLEIDQALSIILTNAMDAIVSKFGDQSIDSGIITIGLSNENNQIVLHITDNGCGMDSETLDKVFMPYFSTKPQGTGDGIGLTLCKAIIERHNGHINLSSTKNSGTTATIILPSYQEE